MIAYSLYLSKQWDENGYFHIGEDRFALLFYGALSTGKSIVQKWHSTTQGIVELFVFP